MGGGVFYVVGLIFFVFWRGRRRFVEGRRVVFFGGFVVFFGVFFLFVFGREIRKGSFVRDSVIFLK